MKNYQQFSEKFEKIKNNLLDDLELQKPNGILRKLMSSDEIKAANILVKQGLIVKGVSDDKQKSVMFYAK